MMFDKDAGIVYNEHEDKFYVVLRFFDLTDVKSITKYIEVIDLCGNVKVLVQTYEQFDKEFYFVGTYWSGLYDLDNCYDQVYRRVRRKSGISITSIISCENKEII